MDGALCFSKDYQQDFDFLEPQITRITQIFNNTDFFSRRCR